MAAPFVCEVPMNGGDSPMSTPSSMSTMGFSSTRLPETVPTTTVPVKTTTFPDIPSTRGLTTLIFSTATFASENTTTTSGSLINSTTTFYGPFTVTTTLGSQQDSTTNTSTVGTTTTTGSNIVSSSQSSQKTHFNNNGFPSGAAASGSRASMPLLAALAAGKAFEYFPKLDSIKRFSGHQGFRKLLRQ